MNIKPFGIMGQRVGRKGEDFVLHTQKNPSRNVLSEKKKFKNGKKNLKKIGKNKNISWLIAMYFFIRKNSYCKNILSHSYRPSFM